MRAGRANQLVERGTAVAAVEGARAFRRARRDVGAARQRPHFAHEITLVFAAAYLGVVRHEADFDADFALELLNRDTDGFQAGDDDRFDLVGRMRSVSGTSQIREIRL